MTESFQRLQKLAEQISAIEMEFEDVFNSSDQLLGAAKDWQLVDLNPKWKKYLGWEISEIVSKPFLFFVHPDDIKRTIDVYNQMAAGHTIEGFTNRYLCKSGKYKAILWNASPFFKDGKSYIDGTTCEPDEE